MSHGRLVEVGWVVAGPLATVDLEAVERARESFRATLAREFPGFEWRVPLVQRPEAIHEPRVELVELLDLGVVERDTHGWDYALVVSEADLVSHHKPFALGAPSQGLSVACLSTSRLDPLARRIDVPPSERTEIMSGRIRALALHLFGHLNDLSHGADPTEFMYDITGVRELDGMTSFSEEAREDLAEELVRVADVRLEESGRYGGRELLFFVKALGHRVGDIVSAVVEARPWFFPLRFSRLTTAAATTMVILMMTAEAWELGMSQPAARVGAASVLALLATSGFLLKRQQLLARRRRRRLSEQRVVANVSMTLSVVLGMATTYALLLLVTLSGSMMFFAPEVVSGWTGLPSSDVGLERYLVLSGFIATVGLVIGALGASFEARGYFRHIALVDEET